MTDYTVNDLHFLMLHAGIAHHHGASGNVGREEPLCSPLLLSLIHILLT